VARGFFGKIGGFFVRLPWIGKILVAGLAGVVGVLGQDIARSPGDWYAKIAPAKIYLRVANEGTDKVELSPAAREKLDRLIREFASQIDGELKKPWEEIQGFRAWSLAQTTLAIHGLHEFDRPRLHRTLLDLSTKACICWQEFAQTPPHVGVTSWVTYSLSRTGNMPEWLDPEFLLGAQKPDGWWPLHPANDNQVNASTYATAWAVLALGHYAGARRQALEKERALADRIELAISRGLVWLKRHKMDGMPRWQDYPLGHAPQRSLSISGLVLYTMHTNPRSDDLLTLDRAWLDALDGSLVESDDLEQSDGTIFMPSGPPVNDRTRHIKLPWAILGTLAAYKNGTAWQRAKAIAWFERTVQSELLTRSVRNRPWVAAELLISLKELKRRSAL
jgi:hypothetical protein